MDVVISLPVRAFFPVGSRQTSFFRTASLTAFLSLMEIVSSLFFSADNQGVSFYDFASAITSTDLVQLPSLAAKPTF